jgi:hypothetical protein
MLNPLSAASHRPRSLRAVGLAIVLYGPKRRRFKSQNLNLMDLQVRSLSKRSRHSTSAPHSPRASTTTQFLADGNVAVRTRVSPWRTQCRSHPSPGKFPTNRDFYREFRDFAASGRSVGARSHCAAVTFGQFPTRINRENILKNTDFSSENREFSCAKRKRS